MTGAMPADNCAAADATGTPPAVPPMLSVRVPNVVAPAAVVTVSVAQSASAGFGLNDPSAPSGKPLTDKFTGPLKLLRASPML